MSVEVCLAALARQSRPADEISPGRAYYPHHLGFDHGPLLREVRRRFALERIAGSPFPALPAWLNSELYVRATARPAV